MIDPVKYRAVEQAPLIPQISHFREFSHEAISMANPDGRAVWRNILAVTDIQRPLTFDRLVWPSTYSQEKLSSG